MEGRTQVSPNEIAAEWLCRAMASAGVSVYELSLKTRVTPPAIYNILHASSKNSCRFDTLCVLISGCGLEIGSPQKKSVQTIRKVWRKNKNWQKEHPEAVKAQQELGLAIKRVDVVKPERCENCGKKRRLDGHHDDYDKPLDVIWLCRFCHRAVDRRKKL